MMSRRISMILAPLFATCLGHAVAEDESTVRGQASGLLHAGDLTSHGSFEQFRKELLANRLLVSADKVEYRFGPAKNHLKATLYDGDRPEKFSLPRINGKPVDLRPKWTFQSPYLKGGFGSDQIDVTVGPVTRRLNFSK